MSAVIPITRGADWRPALQACDLDDQEMRGVTIGELKLVLLRADGELVAYQDACPHEGYPLSAHGERQDFVIMCRKHLWEFDAATGEHISRLPRAECNLRRYRVREMEGRIEVDVASSQPAEPGSPSPVCGPI